MPAPGLGWRDLSPCIFPKPTPIFDFSPMLAFDRDRRKLVLYGGLSRSYAGLPPGIGAPAINQWELDADSGAWTDRTDCPPVAFVALNGVMVYDTRRRRLVIFTGVNGNVGEWDPASGQWTDRPFPFDGTPFPAGPPLAAVYDEARGKAIVFIENDFLLGGMSAWEWDPAGRWSERAGPSDLPFPEPYVPAIAYDADRGRCGCSAAAATGGSIICGGGMSATRLPRSSMSRRRLALPRGPPNVSPPGCPTTPRAGG